MIVYADGGRDERPAAVIERIALLARPIAGDDPAAGADRVRSALLLAGELEQAAHDRLPELLDADEAQRRMAPLQTLTARLADALLVTHGAPGHARGRDGARVVRDEVARAAEDALHVADELLPLRTSAGPAFHALYPEQYIEAAHHWCRAHGGAAGSAAVVGLRSAGTALAAVVTAVLRASGRKVATASCRPHGDPPARGVELDAGALAGARFGLIVGAGPGNSGSSMASVADALVRAGIERADVSFFPGHDQLPRRAASDEVRAWWSAVPRFFAPLPRVLLGGRPLYEALAAALPPVESAAEHELVVEDLGAGRWRAVAYAAPGAWPAARGTFERPKLRLSLGSRRFLFVFAGLNAEPGGVRSTSERFAELLRERADGGWALAPAAVAHGFVAVPWVDATPLAHRDLDPALVDHLGRYIAAVAHAPLSAEEQRAAVERLEHMLCVNVEELLGAEAGSRARALCERIGGAQLPATPRAYGDGRLSPQHFMRTLAGRVLKAGGVARDADHTAIGAQAVLWDLAGASVEWGLDPESKQALLAAHRAAGGEAVQPSALRFYELAYAAFRAAQVVLCASELAEGDAERERLDRARAFYVAELERALFGAR